MYHVFIELWKHEWKFRRTRNAFFEFSQNFMSVYNSIETWRTCFLFLLENTTTSKGKQLLYFDHENVNSLCSCHYYVNSMLVLCLC